MQLAEEVRFDGWTVRADSGELTKNGYTIRLRKQPMQVLASLLAHPGEVVSRAQLIAALWPKGVVDFDTALNSAVRRLRSALGDDADIPRYIETLPRRGYRFIAALEYKSATNAIQPAAALVGSATRRSLLNGATAAAMVSVALTAAIGLSHDSLSGDLRWREAHVSQQESVVDRPTSTTTASSNPQAIEHYLRARYFLQHRAPGDFEHARAYFEQALILDPNLAEAAAGLASAYWLLITENAIPIEIGSAHMRSAAERALQINPNSVEAHQRLLNYAFITSTRPRDADLDAIDHVDPASAMALSNRSGQALEEGSDDESVELARRAAMAEPLNLAYRYNLACTLFAIGRFEEAKQVNLEVLEMNPTYKADIAAQAMILQGDSEQALQMALRWPEGPERRETRALALYALRRPAEADKALAELVQTDHDSDPVRIAEVYAFRGELVEAFRWLDIASDVFRDPHTRVLAGVTPDSILFSPFLKPLREDARWGKLSSTAFVTQ